MDHERFEALLNDCGREGWELVNVFDLNMSYGASREVVAVFRRAC